MLKFLFEWFDAHDFSYWAIAAVPTLLLFVWSVRMVCRQPAQISSRRNEALFALLVLAVLVAWRWPFLLSADEFNPDESQLIAGAITLRVDPVPWRGVDGFTSGPLNFYPLLLPALFGLPLDYFTARLAGLLLIWGALIACYRLLRSRFGPVTARVSIFPALAFFSTVTDADFIHYSSEHLALFLTALSAYFILNRGDDPRAGARQTAGCFVAGLLPLAKLQSGPLAAALVVIALLTPTAKLGEPKWRILEIAIRLGAAIAPTLVLLLVVIVTGQWEHFFRSYLLQNLVYVGDGTSFSAALQGLWQTSRTTGHFQFFLALSVFGASLGAFALGRSIKRDFSWFAGAGLFAASAISILGARRALVHYLLLSVIPLTLWGGFGLGRWLTTRPAGRRTRFCLLALLFGLAGPFSFRAAHPVPPVFGSFASFWREPHTALGSLLRSYKTSRSRLAIWGWLPSLYVESGMAQGTRDGNSSWAMIPSQYREYYRLRFIADIERTSPDFFVDAVGLGARFFPDRTQFGHESVPALDEYVQGHYELVTDVGYARFYAKKGLPAPQLPEATKLGLEIAKAELGNHDSLPRISISPADLPTQQVRTGFAQMMHPPAEIVWALDEMTREIIFEYGFLPEGQRRSDGVELIFELRSNDAPTRHLFYRFLDPVRRPADRGPVTSRLVLPPFTPGSRLVARTTVGLSGNGAWDWIYLGRVSPVRLPKYSPRQFPKFNRVPDAADADLAYLLEEPGETVLILDAPASLTYNLDGSQRRLRFDFGFRSGAYSNGGQTDGAIFKVELHRDERPPEVLFEKKLDPTGRTEDRGLHAADFALPAETAGARLILRIDPGAGNAWDWTYITNFVLE